MNFDEALPMVIVIVTDSPDDSVPALPAYSETVGESPEAAV
jgi:hypothetical protein